MQIESRAVSNFDVCVVGLGYIGLPTALLLAEQSLKVVGVDIDETRVKAIAAGDLSTTEPGLSELMKSVIADKPFFARTNPLPSSAFVVAVPTPLNEDHSADLSYLQAAIDSISPLLSPGNLVVIESTCPPGTTLDLMRRVEDHRPDLAGEVHFAYCPERILPGNALSELRTNARTIGGITPEATRMATDLYKVFCEGTLHQTNAATAELVKLAENSFRDVNIALANELSLIADHVGVDVWKVISLANLHPRVHILKPGPGVGGHCIAVDPWFLAQVSPHQTRLIEAARLVNDEKPLWVIEKVEELANQLEAKTIALLGLTFKPNIDDLRESPALLIAQELASRNPDAYYIAVEPNLASAPEHLKGTNIRWSAEAPDPSHLHLVVWLVDHEEFKDIDLGLYADLPVFDARGPKSRR